MATASIGQGGVQVVPGSTQGIFPQWHGFFYATVSSNADPLGLGRCRLRIPQVLGTEVSTWAWAMTSPGGASTGAVASTTAPPVGTVVAATFLGGDLAQPAYVLLTTSAAAVTTTGPGVPPPVTTPPPTGSGTPAITTTSLPPATVGTPYSQSLIASGGIPPYTWSVTSGSLPSGISLNASAGVISGTATAAGSSSFTIQVSDSAGNSISAVFALNAVTSGTSSSSPVGPSGTWSLKFEDQFTGNSLNTNNWTAVTNPNVSQSPASAANVSVSGGYCVLVNQSSAGATIDSSIALQGWGSGANGPTVAVGDCVEARINFAGSSGDANYNWPAFWISGGNWPANGEIDIFEGYNGTPSALNYHNHSGANNGPFPSGSWCNSFHTYTCVRGASAVSVYWDGTLVRTITPSDNGGPQSILVSVAQGGGASATGAASACYVDYIRLWSPG